MLSDPQTNIVCANLACLFIWYFCWFAFWLHSMLFAISNMLCFIQRQNWKSSLWSGCLIMWKLVNDTASLFSPLYKLSSNGISCVGVPTRSRDGQKSFPWWFGWKPVLGFLICQLVAEVHSLASSLELSHDNSHTFLDIFCHRWWTN